MFLNTSKFLTMPSDVDLAKRELVRVLRELAGKHRVTLVLSRERQHDKEETQLEERGLELSLSLLGDNMSKVRIAVNKVPLKY